MGWAFFYMFVILKIPVIAALWLVWWSVREQPGSGEEQRADDGRDDGGHRPPRRPRPPRRGPHAGLPPRPPKRVRARARVASPAHC